MFWVIIMSVTAWSCVRFGTPCQNYMGCLKIMRDVFPGQGATEGSCKVTHAYNYWMYMYNLVVNSKLIRL